MTSEEKESMDESKKVVRTAIFIIFILAVALGIYYFFISGKGKKPGPSEPPIKTQQVTPEEAAGIEGAEAAGLTVPLDQSDDPVRRLVADLSSNLTFANWLKNKDLIRKFVAAVDNVANGLSPRPQLDFFTLGEKFKVIGRTGQTLLDPADYERYNVVADVFDTVSTAGCAKLYRDFKPLFRQAYRDLGYPKEDFHQTFLRAIIEVLKTPVVEDPILLEKKITTYMMVDPVLENLNPPQKHMLRMGPENLQLIQAKLREIGLALGFTEGQLPKPVLYKPVQKK
jgi:hypothetical protein